MSEHDAIQTLVRLAASLPDPVPELPKVPFDRKDANCDRPLTRLFKQGKVKGMKTELLQVPRPKDADPMHDPVDRRNVTRGLSDVLEYEGTLFVMVTGNSTHDYEISVDTKKHDPESDFLDLSEEWKGTGNGNFYVIDVRRRRKIYHERD
jgi:hypothetical protein